MKRKSKLQRDLEKEIRPIVDEFARELERVFKGSKIDRYVSDMLKEAAEMGSKRRG